MKIWEDPCVHADPLLWNSHTKPWTLRITSWMFTVLEPIRWVMKPLTTKVIDITDCCLMIVYPLSFFCNAVDIPEIFVVFTVFWVSLTVKIFWDPQTLKVIWNTGYWCILYLNLWMHTMIYRNTNHSHVHQIWLRHETGPLPQKQSQNCSRSLWWHLHCQCKRKWVPFDPNIGLQTVSTI